jgi:hypothetical protein
MKYYAIVRNSKILFRYPIETSADSLAFYLSCARDKFGSDVTAETHEPNENGLIYKTLPL